MKTQLKLAIMLIITIGSIVFLYAECEDAVPWTEHETVCSYDGDSCNIWQSTCNLYCRWWPFYNCGPTESDLCSWRMFTGTCVKSQAGDSFNCVGTWGDWTNITEEQVNLGSLCL